MRARSAKRQHDAPIRRAVVVRMLEAFPWCGARLEGCTRWSQDVHERLSRARGGDPLDMVQSHGMAVCRSCHEIITQSPARAEVLWLALPSWHRCCPTRAAMALDRVPT